MTDDSYAAGVGEIEALRARLRNLEDIARQPRPGLGDAIGDAMTAQPPPDPGRRKLENAAHGFHPDLESEAALEARAADPERFDHDFRSMGGDSLTLALYADQRAAAIAIGAWKPTKETK